jgi:hypothetical protein
MATVGLFPISGVGPAAARNARTRLAWSTSSTHISSYLFTEPVGATAKSGSWHAAGDVGRDSRRIEAQEADPNGYVSPETFFPDRLVQGDPFQNLMYTNATVSNVEYK